MKAFAIYFLRERLNVYTSNLKDGGDLQPKGIFCFF
jgi:hypothetical protein